MGLLDILNSDEGRMGMGLLAAAGPRSDGAGFGQRLQEGMGSFDAYKQNALKQKMLEAQMQEWQQKTAQEKMALEMAQRKQAAMANAWTSPVSQGSFSIPEMGGVEMFSQGAKIGTPSVQGRPTLNVKNLIANNVTPDEISKLDSLRNIGLDEVARTVEGTGADGRPVTYQKDKFGRDVGAAVPKWVADTQADLGGSVGFLNPFTHQPTATQQKTMTFGDRNAAGNLALSRERLHWDQNGGSEGGTSQTGFTKQFGKPAAGYRWKSDGSQEFIPGGPADQKAQLQKSGEGTVGSVVAELRDKYSMLNDGGGVVNNEKGALSNLGAWSASSGLGQTLGGAVGTKNQNTRDAVAMTRPLLLQAIMKATGMSSKQMDSNAELKLYLATATDPTKGYQANMEALDRIEKLYGGGSQPTKQPALDALPSPVQHKGKTLRDTTTGKLLTSNGMQWVEAK